MKIDFSSWREADVFNLGQILMTAKFASTRGSVMMGAPLVNELLRQVHGYPYSDPHLVAAVRRLPQTPVPADALKEMEAICRNASDVMKQWDDEQAAERLEVMAYPFLIRKDQIADLVAIVRAEKNGQ